MNLGHSILEAVQVRRDCSYRQIAKFMAAGMNASSKFLCAEGVTQRSRGFELSARFGKPSH